MLVTTDDAFAYKFCTYKNPPLLTKEELPTRPDAPSVDASADASAEPVLIPVFMGVIITTTPLVIDRS